MEDFAIRGGSKASCLGEHLECNPCDGLAVYDFVESKRACSEVLLSHLRDWIIPTGLI